MSLARLWHDQGKVREAREGRTYPASDCRRERGYGANCERTDLDTGSYSNWLS
jgi:hypothetical protein